MGKVAVSASGGLDSTVLAAQMVKEHGAENVHMLFGDISEVASFKSWRYVKHHARRFGCHADLIKISIPSSVRSAFYRFSKDESLKERRRRERLFKQDKRGSDLSRMDTKELVKHYIPGMCTAIWTGLVAHATMLGCDTFVTGLMDRDGRTDTVSGAGMDSSTEFFEHLHYARLYIWGSNSPDLVMPFRDLSKSDVTALGVQLGVEIAQTTSCDLHPPCGVCHECLMRKKAIDDLS